AHELAGEHDLLLVAAGERPDRRADVGGLDGDPPQEVLRDGPLPASVEPEAELREVAQVGAGDVERDRLVREHALLLAVARQHRNAGGRGVLRGAQPHLLAVDADGALVGGGDAVEGAGDRAGARAPTRSAPSPRSGSAGGPWPRTARGRPSARPPAAPSARWSAWWRPPRRRAAR